MHLLFLALALNAPIPRADAPVKWTNNPIVALAPIDVDFGCGYGDNPNISIYDEEFLDYQDCKLKGLWAFDEVGYL